MSNPVPKPNVGGFFAPSMTSEKVAKYKTLIGNVERPDIKEAMQNLLNLAYKKKSSSVAGGTPFKENLDEHIPWDWEMQAYAKLFEAIPAGTQKELRDAAFHLLWWAEQLDKGFEPTTADKL